MEIKVNNKNIIIYKNNKIAKCKIKVFKMITTKF